MLTLPKSGRSYRCRAYHNTSTGKVKFGSGGAFFAPAPTPEYGDTVLTCVLSFRKVLVVGDQVDAAEAVAPEQLVEITRIVEDELPSLGADCPALYYKMDTAIATAARKKGYDGIIYNQICTLSEYEIIALYKRVYKIVGVEHLD